MIYQPRNVQPSGVSIDGLLDNTFTMEIQTNSYVSAYQLLIVDFDNNEIYTGSKTTLANYAYNGDILEIPVSASAVALSNGTNYKWRVRLYQPTADMLITYGLVQATSTTTTIYLQPNINIKAGMAITINSQTKTISSYNSDTGVAVVSNAFSSAPAVGTQYKIYSDFIETVPDYIVYARQTPTVAISNVPSSLTLKYHTFQGTYTQSDNVPIVYHQFDLYTRNDDGTISLVTSSDKVYSANLSYTYDSFRTGNEYLIQMTVENDMGIISTTDMYEFNVSYDIVEYLQQPLASFDDKNNAVKVSWVTPVENEATSFRSDAAIGIIQDNNNTLTQATFEPGQSIGEGDVVQITNSDCELVIDGKSTQATRSGKNIFNKNSTFKEDGATKEVLETGVRSKITTAGIYRCFSVELGKSELLGKTITITRTITNSASNRGRLSLFFGNETSQGKKFIFSNSGSINIPNTFPEDCDRIWAVFYGNVAGTGNVGDYTDYTDLMITLGDTLQNYEDYGVMPSPDYPSEIESVKGKNLIPNNWKLVDANYTKEYGKLTVSANLSTSYLYGSSTNFIGLTLKAGTYTFSASSNTFSNIYAVVNNNGTIENWNNSITKTFTSDVVVQSIRCNEVTLSTGTYLWISQIEKGTVATNYLPYDTIQVKSVGKNLFDISKVISNWGSSTNTGIKNNNNGTLTVSSPSASTTSIGLAPNTLKDYCPNLQVGDVVYLNATTTGTNKYIYLDVSVSLWSFGTKRTITQNDLDSKVYWYASGVNTTATISDIMISTDGGEYEPYQENILNIDLQGNELCSLPNNVKDELVIENGRAKIIKNVAKMIVENGNFYVGTTWNGYFVQPEGKINEANNRLLCDRAIANRTYTDGTMYDNRANVMFVGNNTDTIETLKAKYDGATLYYQLATPTEIDLGDSAIPYIDGINYMHISSNMDTTFSLVYPHKTISGNTYDYTEFNPPGVKQTGTIKSYNAITGIGTLMPQYPFMYTPMQGDSYAVISNIYNVSGFSYLYNTPYNTVNSLYTHGYTATWATPDGLCVLPDDFNITLQFSPDGNFFYDQNGVYQEVVNLITTETDDANNKGEFTIKIDKNKLIFVQNPDISLELPFYTNTTQVFVLSSASVAQINNDYVWDDTATWTDTYTWVEGGTSLERVCNHWWKVQITNTGIKIEEIFPTT